MIGSLAGVVVEIISQAETSSSEVG